MKDTLQTAGVVVAIMVGLSTLAGLAARFVLLPWIKEHVALPLGGVLDEIRTDIRAMARAYDGHLEWSQAEVDRIWDAIKDLRRYKNRKTP